MLAKKTWRIVAIRQIRQSFVLYGTCYAVMYIRIPYYVVCFYTSYLKGAPNHAYYIQAYHKSIRILQLD